MKSTVFCNCINKKKRKIKFGMMYNNICQTQCKNVHLMKETNLGSNNGARNTRDQLWTAKYSSVCNV